MDYQKRVNPNLGGVDHSKQTKSPWEKGGYISMNSIIIREYEAKKGKKPDSFEKRKDYEYKRENFLHHERRILKKCILYLNVEVKPTTRNGNGYAFCLLDAEFCYFLLTNNRKAKGFFSKLKQGEPLATSQVEQFIYDFSFYLDSQHNCTLIEALKDPAMCKGSFFLPFFKKHKIFE